MQILMTKTAKVELRESMIITIDGPAGSGKSTVAALVAERLAARHLDTGAMYRAVTLAGLEQGVDLDDPAAVEALGRGCRIELADAGDCRRVLLNGRDVTEDIRSTSVSDQAHKVARVGALRELLISQQRRIAQDAGTLVTEGRDQGTVVFPEAKYKFYLDASPACRAQRRWKQMQSQGIGSTVEEVMAAQEQRDRRDAARRVGPLKPAPDAIIVDTTEMPLEEVVESLYRHVSQAGRTDERDSR